MSILWAVLLKLFSNAEGHRLKKQEQAVTEQTEKPLPPIPLNSTALMAYIAGSPRQRLSLPTLQRWREHLRSHRRRSVTVAFKLSVVRPFSNTCKAIGAVASQTPPRQSWFRRLISRQSLPSVPSRVRRCATCCGRVQVADGP